MPSVDPDIRRLVDQAPPLSAAVKARLALILQAPVNTRVTQAVAQ